MDRLESTRLISLFGALSLVCAALFACGKSETAESGESHFLAFCDADACGDGMACVCGVCTIACTDSTACGGLASGATCEAASASCDVSSVCDFSCEGGADCAELGDGYACADGSCRKGEPPSEPPPFSECETPPATSCNFEDTCAQIDCGGQQFDENGCQRPTCENDEGCSEDEVCVHLDAIHTAACDMTSGTCQCEGPTIAIPGAFCNPRPPLGELCDGSDSARLVMGGGGGHVEDTYEFLTPDGEYVVVDGQCRYYAVGSDPSRILSGTLSESEAEALAAGVGWSSFESWTPYIDQQSCPDAGSTYLLAPEVVLTCTCGCDDDAPAGLEAALTQANAQTTALQSQGVALENATLQAVARPAAELQDPGSQPILEWTLALPLEDLVIPAGGTYQEDSGVLVEDAGTIAALLELRDESGARPTGYVFVEDADGARYGVLLRADLPAALDADVTAIRERAFR